jgi:hypothetical protein
MIWTNEPDVKVLAIRAHACNRLPDVTLAFRSRRSFLIEHNHENLGGGIHGRWGPTLRHVRLDDSWNGRDNIS